VQTSAAIYKTGNRAEDGGLGETGRAVVRRERRILAVGRGALLDDGTGGASFSRTCSASRHERSTRPPVTISAARKKEISPEKCVRRDHSDQRADRPVDDSPQNWRMAKK